MKLGIMLLALSLSWNIFAESCCVKTNNSLEIAPNMYQFSCNFHKLKKNGSCPGGFRLIDTQYYVQANTGQPFQCPKTSRQRSRSRAYLGGATGNQSCLSIDLTAIMTIVYVGIDPIKFTRGNLNISKKK
jgi:hypothetical protein